MSTFLAAISPIIYAIGFLVTIKTRELFYFDLVSYSLAAFCFYSVIKADHWAWSVMGLVGIVILIFLDGVEDCMLPPIRHPTPEKIAYVEKQCTRYLWQYLPKNFKP